MPPSSCAHQCNGLDQSGERLMPRGTIERTKVRLPTVLLIHPFEVAFAALFELVGAGLLLQGGRVRVSSVQTLPEALVLCWEVFLLVAGPAIVTGLLWRGKPAMGRALEIAGLGLGAAAWGTYAITMWVVLGVVATIPAMQGVTIAAASMARIGALHRVEKVIAKVNAAPVPEVTE